MNRDAAASASPETPADHEPWKGIWDQLFFSLNAYACALIETFLGPCLQCSRQLFLKLLSARYFSAQTEVPLKSKSTYLNWELGFFWICLVKHPATLLR